MSAEAPGTPTWLAARNARTALTLLLEHGPLTRARLGELTGLSKPTAAQLVGRLQADGVIGPVGEVSLGRGPNAVAFGVLPDRIRGVAIDVREHAIVATVVDALDADHPRVELPTAGCPRSPAADLRRAVEAACAATGVDVASIGVVVAGVQAAVADDGDRLAFTDTLPGWPATGARTEAESGTGATVRLANDVDLAADAERAIGASADSAVAALLWLEEGIGLAVDEAGTIRPGAHGAAGEIGYLPVPRGAERIDPAALDLTDLVGGPAIAALRARSGADADLPLPELLALPAVAAELAERIALALAPVVAIVDPELVVLGGPTGVAGGPALATRVAGLLAEPGGASPAVAASRIDADAVLRGARARALADIHDALLAGVGTASFRERTAL